MEKILPALSWSPRWMSLMGCVSASSKFLGLGNTDAWLYGSSGFSSVLNVHWWMCPSGPTAWKTARSLGLLANAGLRVDGLVAWDSQSDYPQRYVDTAAIIRTAIEEGMPAVVFWAVKPEYYIVRGLNDDGIFISGVGSEEVPFKPWTKINEWHMLEVLAFSPKEKAGDSKVVADSLKFAIDAWNGHESLTIENYHMGFAGFDSWIGAFDQEKLDSMGLAYNSQVWAETRMMQVDFLREVANKLKMKDAFRKAIDCAIISAECLKMVATQFPMVGMHDSHKADPERIATARTALSTAKNVESEMISEFEKVINSI